MEQNAQGCDGIGLVHVIPVQYYSTEAKLLGFITPGDIPLIAVLAIGLLTPAVLLATKRYDPTHGFLTVSLVVIFAIVCAAFASMVYPIASNNAVTDALVGALSAALGAVISQWLPRWPSASTSIRPPPMGENPSDDDEMNGRI